jgi:hypothetical protein
VSLPPPPSPSTVQRRHRSNGGAKIAGISTFVLVAALLLIADAGGPGSVDPTDPSNFSEVTVVNDLTAPVRLMQCDTSCATIHDIYELLPDTSKSLSVAWGFPVGYYVASEIGQSLGCLRFYFPHRVTSVVVLVSTIREVPPPVCPD